mgnify:CR=1 FL=1
MAMDRFVIELIANSLYEEELGKRLGLNPHSEYGRKKLNEYLELSKIMNQWIAFIKTVL